jgi:hypothetical protein
MWGSNELTFFYGRGGFSKAPGHARVVATHHGKDMADNLSLSGMFRSVPRVEQPSSNTDEGIVELGLDETVTVAVYFGDSIVICDRDMVGSDSDEFAVLLVLVVNDLVSVSISGLSGDP